MVLQIHKEHSLTLFFSFALIEMQTKLYKYSICSVTETHQAEISAKVRITDAPE